MSAAVAIYSIAVGALMAGLWANDLRTGAWDRGDRSHAELALHLAAEFLTAGWLIGAGAALLAAGHVAAPFLAVGIGMLLYTTIVSPGYFLARRELAPVAMFVVIIALTMTAAVTLLAGL